LRVYGQNGTPLANPALDLSGETCSNSERGLLGVALDPHFGRTNNYIYLYYTYNKHAANPCPERDPNNPVNRVSRFVMSGNTVDPASETVLLDNIPSPAGNHNGGDLHFGKDGYLYVSVGDGGCDYAEPTKCGAYNDAAQEPGVLVGKILRITRWGGIPSTNPYTGTGSERCGDRGNDGHTEGKKCREIFTKGLRNPFRMAFNPDATRTRFRINDVGQARWEEIDRGRRRANYAWNLCEGTHDNVNRTGSVDCTASPYTPPIHEYNHDTGCRSITGGAFVPDGVWPASYNNAYLFADFVCNKIFKLTCKRGGGFTKTVFADGLASGGPVSMSFGPWGEREALYYTTFADGGQIRRIAHHGS
jgi:glucose/arabinose dehydrogenase